MKNAKLIKKTVKQTILLVTVKSWGIFYKLSELLLFYYSRVFILSGTWFTKLFMTKKYVKYHNAYILLQYT